MEFVASHFKLAHIRPTNANISVELIAYLADGTRSRFCSACFSIFTQKKYSNATKTKTIKLKIVAKKCLK